MRNVVAALMATGTQFGRTEMEILTAASRLSKELGGSLTALILGLPDDSFIDHCLEYGATKVAVPENPALGHYQPGLFAIAAEQGIRSLNGEIALFPSTTKGLELAPLVGYKLRASVVMDVVGVDGKVEGGGVRVQKPVFGGKAQSSLLARKAPLVIALRMRSIAPTPTTENVPRDVTKIAVSLPGPSASWRVIRQEIERAEGVRLEDARIVISGGRGMGAKENFACLEQLGKEMGAALGASRAAVDLGWVPSTWQVGQTGKKIAPDVYVAVGISGASQHMVGVAAAKHIVAINKDEKAPIFQMAEVGVVEDYSAFIPKLIDAVKKRKTSAASV